MYDDIFIYVPSVNRIVRIAEGTGDSLTEKDKELGYIDYVYFDVHAMMSELPVVDGGILMLKKPLREQYVSLAQAIPDVLDLAWNTKDAEYVSLNGLATK